MKATKKAATKAVQAVFIMSNAALDKIVAGYDKLETTYREQRSEAVKQIVFNLPEGVLSTAANKEYNRRVNYVVAKLAKRHKDAEPASIRRALERDLKAVGWSAPRAERTEGEKAETARKAEANRKLIARTAAKLMKEAKAHNPKMKIKPEIFTIQAREQVAEMRDAGKEATKQKADHARAFVEQTKRFTMPELLAAFNECMFSDDADWNAECESRFAAAIAFAKNRAV